MQVHLQPGDYVSAGIDMPWIATHGMVESALTSMGFSSFQWKGEDKDGIETVSAAYNGPDKYYDLPSQVKWFNVTPNQAGFSSPTGVLDNMTRAAEHLDSNVIIGIGLLELSFTWLVASLFKRKAER